MSLKSHKNRTTIVFDVWFCFGKPFLNKNTFFFTKNGSQTEPKLDLKSNLCARRTSHFHSWVDNVAQVVPKGAQMVARVAKSCQNGAKMLPFASSLTRCYGNVPRVGGLPLSYIYIYIYTCSDKGDRKALQGIRVDGRQ